jgi:hypothetical protein
MEQGSDWEQVFGGVLIVQTSPTTAKEIEEQLRRIAAEKMPMHYEGRLTPPRHSGC